MALEGRDGTPCPGRFLLFNCVYGTKVVCPFPSLGKSYSATAKTESQRHNYRVLGDSYHTRSMIVVYQ